MTYTELQALAAEYCEIWGYANVAVVPDWAVLVNRAYRQVCLASECMRAETTFPTVIGTSEYALTGVKAVLDVYYDEDTLNALDEAVLRRYYPNWLLMDNDTPWAYLRTRPGFIRLFPTPAAIKTVTVWGVVAPDALVDPGDEPVVPEEYQEAIALRAAWLHASKFVKGDDARANLAEYNAQVQDAIDSIKQLNSVEASSGGYRETPPIEPERVYA